MRYLEMFLGKKVALGYCAAFGTLLPPNLKRHCQTLGRLSSLIVVMFGGFGNNFIWYVGLNIKNRSGYEYLDSHRRQPANGMDRTSTENPIDAPAEEVVKQGGMASNSSDLQTDWVSQFGRFTWRTSSSSARYEAIIL